MTKKKQVEQLGNREIIIIIIILGIALPFMYYIGFPALKQFNDKVMYENDLRDECYYKTATLFCESKSMTLTYYGQWGFSCINDTMLRNTRRPIRFNFLPQEQKLCYSGNINELKEFALGRKQE